MVTFRSLEEFDKDHGTVKLLDASHRFKSKENSDVVLIPQPTDDPNDPLNWPYLKKITAVSWAGALACVAGWVVGGLASGVPELMNEFGTDLHTTTNAALNWPVLMLGLGVFWWVPTVGYIGVRPTALSATFILLISCVWGGLSHGFKSFEAARIIAAWAVSCGEILPGIIVKDVFYLHERGSWMGLYMIFFQSLPAVGLIASGFVITGGGFRWYFWVFSPNVIVANGKFLTIVSAVIFFAMIFFLPETQYARSSASLAPSAPPSHLTERKPSTFSEKSQTSTIPVKKPYLQELKPWSGINPNGHKASFLFLFLRGWPFIVYPAVLYSTVVFGLAVSSLLVVVGTAPTVFQAPPYNMTAGIQSCIYTAMFIGAFLGAIWGGYGTDLISKYRASKNGGVFESESRLLLMLAPTVLVPSGLLMYGFGIGDFYPWPLAWIGVGLISFGLAGIPAITMSYAVDCYYPVAEEAIFLIVGLKNIISFGFSYAVDPWQVSLLPSSQSLTGLRVAEWGYKRAIGCFAAIMFATLLLGAPLYLFGKKLRFASAKWKVIAW